jgi:hypothetical protein
MRVVCRLAWAHCGTGDAVTDTCPSREAWRRPWLRGPCRNAPPAGLSHFKTHHCAQRIGGITTAAVAYAFRIVGLPLTCTSVAFCDRASTPHRVAETGRTRAPCCCEAQSMSTQPIQVARLLRHRTCGPCHRCHVPLRSNFTRAFGRAEVSGTALCDLCCTRRTPMCLSCGCRLYQVAWVLQSALLCVP